MTEYVLGLAYGRYGAFLIKKDATSACGGGYNGVGGKVEQGETPMQAMEREWVEETGLRSPQWAPNGWMSFGEEQCRVCLFAANLEGAPDLLEDRIGEGEFDLEQISWSQVFDPNNHGAEFSAYLREALAMVVFSPDRRNALYVPT